MKSPDWLVRKEQHDGNKLIGDINEEDKVV